MGEVFGIRRQVSSPRPYALCRLTHQAGSLLRTRRFVRMGGCDVTQTRLRFGNNFAIPKSSYLGTPSFVTRMLLGLMSR